MPDTKRKYQSGHEEWKDTIDFIAFTGHKYNTDKYKAYTHTHTHSCSCAKQQQQKPCHRHQEHQHQQAKQTASICIFTQRIRLPAISTVYYLQCTFLFKTVGLALWYRTHRLIWFFFFGFVVFHFAFYRFRFSVRDKLFRFIFLVLVLVLVCFFGFFVCYYSNLLHLHAFCKFKGKLSV